jgi:cyclohexyl-isocyanide hydratase
MTTRIGMLLYPGLTQLDLTGPFEVLHRIPGAEVFLVWKEKGIVVADSGLGLVADTTLAACPPLDVVFVPGGFGQIALLGDEAVLSFLREQARGARWVTSVCTGALLLGAAGLLGGYQAATHWAYQELLPSFGATPVRRRVVVDRNRVTGGGVTAGIDFALRLAAEIAGEDVARAIQLGLEYDPDPPFRSGHPDVADPALVTTVRAAMAERVAARQAAIGRLSGLDLSHDRGEQRVHRRLESGPLHDRLAVSDARAHRAQRALQRGEPHAPPLGVRDGAGDRDDLPLELGGADDPVDAVLQRAGQAVPVLGGRDEHGVAGGQRASPGGDGGVLAVPLELGVERRQVTQPVEDNDLDAGRRPRGRRVQQREVPRPCLEAARQSDDSHGRQRSALPCARQRRCQNTF